MDTRQQSTGRRMRRAFTMIELLTVIAIIAILAAILFPVFGTVREQARQSNTLSNMQQIYVAVRQYVDDEGRFPPVLFGYAEGQGPSILPYIAMEATDPNLAGMDQITKGTLYREHRKAYNEFTNADNTVTDRRVVTEAYYPLTSPFKPGERVVWEGPGGTFPDGCAMNGDPDLPNDSYIGQPKLFYAMDSMDIGPRVDADGKAVRDGNNQIIYDLHYSPDWTRRLGAVCDRGADGKPVVTQLKYKNPPTDRTVITYSTHHVATAGSPSVIVLLLSGQARKVNYRDALGFTDPNKALPLHY